MKKEIKTKSLFILIILLTSTISTYAATKYWIGTGAATWGNGANWSISSGGGGGAGAPGSGDVATFDANGGNCNINSSANPGTLTVTSGYAGTISQNAGISIGSGGASLSGGTFTGGGAGITCGGHFTISGMAFTSTSGTLTVGGNFTLSSGSFTHNSGTTLFAVSKTITGSTTFYNLTLGTPSGGAATHTVASGTALTVTHTLTLSTTNALTINTGEIYAQGDITINNTATGGGGSALIKINGTGSQTLTGSGTAGTGKLCKVEIDKSAGTLTLASIISVDNDWTYTTGTVSSGSGTPTVATCSSLNLDCQGSGATMSFYNLTIYGGTTTLAGNVGITNNLTINNSTTLSGSSYTINLSGQWTNNGTFTYSTSTVQLQGTALQTINTSSSTETFYNLTVNKTSGRVLLNDPLIINNAVTFTEGIIKATGSNYFKLIDNATATAGNDSAFVYGYYKKVGDEAFTFALGDTSVSTGGYHPLSIGAPSSATDAYTAQYFNSVQTNGTTRDSILNYTSTCEYWNLARDAGSSNVTVKLGWNTTSCNIDSLTDIRVAYWNGSKWKDKGGSYTGNTTIGDVVTSSAQSAFGDFIIAKKYPNANAGTDVTACSGSSTNLVGSSGTSYNWSPSTALSCTNCYNPTASPTSTITYTYTVTYPSGYQSSDNVTVNMFAAGTACCTAISVPYEGYCYNNDTSQISDKWFKFVKDTLFLEESISLQNADSTYGFIHSISLYSGSCGSQTLLEIDTATSSSDDLEIKTNTLTEGDTYYVKVSRKTSGCSFCSASATSKYDFCIQGLISYTPDLFGCIRDCNLILNPDLESGKIPIHKGDWTNGYVNCWRRYGCQYSPKHSNNVFGSPDIFDANYSPSVNEVIYNNCNEGATGLGIPSNFASSSTPHNSIYSGHRYGMLYARESATCNLTNSLRPRIYLLEFYYSRACYTTAPGSINVALVDINKVNGGGDCLNLGETISNVAYIDVSGASTGTWNVSGACVDLTGQTQTFLSSHKNLEFYHAASPATSIFVDNFKLWRLADAGPDVSKTCSEPKQIGPECKSDLAVTYLWIDPEYLLSDIHVANPYVQGTNIPNAPFSKDFVLGVTYGGCTDYDTVKVTFMPAEVPVIAGPRSLCAYDSKIICATSGYTSYSWTVSPTPNSISGASTDCVTFGYTSQPSGNVIVTLNYTSPGGCDGEITYTLYECCDCPGIEGIVPGTSCHTLADMNISTFAYGTTLTETYYFNGVITINANTTFEGAYINFSPNAKIDILPGYTLTIKNDVNASTNSILQKGCDEMWDGIYINGTTAKLVCDAVSPGGGTYNYIKDAINAVVSVDGGDYDIERTLFQNNYKGIVVKPYSGTHTGVIKTSTFTNTHVSRELQFTPYSGVTSLCGFEVSGVYDLTVGTIGAGLENTFEIMDYGIKYDNLYKTYAYTSTLKTYNNLFSDIITGGTSGFCGIGIVAEGESTAPISLKIGSATTYAYNSFDHCTYGIFSSQFCKTEVKNNLCFSNEVTDFTCFRNNGAITIKDNVSSGYNRGVWVIDPVRFAMVDIDNNTFATALSPGTFLNYENTAILVQNVNLRPIGCTIHDNTIQNFRNGIICTNIFGGKVYDNALSAPLTPGGSFVITGIYDELGRFNTIENNTLTFAGNTPSSGQATYLYGIYASNSRQVTIRHNDVTNYYDGIVARWACNDSKFYCNTLTTCYNGFNFLGVATIGHQLQASIPTGNTWSGIINYSLTGDIKPIIHWYYTNSGTERPLPTAVMIPLSLYNTDLPETTLVANACSTPPGGGGNGQKRQAALEDAIVDTVQYPYSQAAFSYFNKKYAFLSLLNDVHDTSWLNLSLTADALYQDFFDSCQTTNLAMYAAVQEYMDTSEVDAALGFNSTIVDSNQFESDRKLINDIYLRTWMSGTRDFTSPQRDTLEYIANLHSNEFGDAVISARVLLGLEVKDNEAGSGLRKSRPRKEQENQPLYKQAETPITKLYPNPSKGEISIDMSEEGKIEMYNILGEKVIFSTLAKGTTTLSTMMLQPGIYIYSININGRIAKRDKLVISK